MQSYKKKQVYLAISADYVHSGHLNIIKVARELGEVTVGVLTDKAIAAYEQLPLLGFDDRVNVMKNIKGVSHVIPQETQSYTKNLNQLMPDYVVHGDDWKSGPLSAIREQVINQLAQWGGKLVEPRFTKGLSSSHLMRSLRHRGVTTEIRRGTLARLLAVRPIVRILEVHNGLCGLIVENTQVSTGGTAKEFDGMWESSLTDATSKGKPDTSAVDVSSRINTINQILEVTTKPMIVDADNGGLPEHFSFTVRTLERLGVSAVIIEDKVGPKKNSLFGSEVRQYQDSIESFCDKIASGKRSQVTNEFMIIARIESLILNKGQEDAIERARAYIGAGADGIMIHSREKSPDEILAFCKAYHKLCFGVPLVVVPSTYSEITEKDLEEAGVRIVIYANHLLRSAFPSMLVTAKSILTHGRCHEAGESCMSIRDIISLVPDTI
jgi:phosphoenolpyruvate phosphomutase / 2-hydroxyethylphosphonate cytidylyltransferase